MGGRGIDIGIGNKSSAQYGIFWVFFGVFRCKLETDSAPRSSFENIIANNLAHLLPGSYKYLTTTIRLFLLTRMDNQRHDSHRCLDIFPP